MRNKIIFSLCLCLSIFILVKYANGEVKGNDEREENIKKFLRDYLEIELNDKSKIQFYDALPDKSIFGPKANFRVFINDKITLVINQNGSEVYSFVNANEKKITEETKNITTVEAFNKIKKLLKLYKLPEDMSKYSITTENEYYFIRSANIEIENISCRGSGFSCNLSKQNGSICQFSYKPAYLPINKKPPQYKWNREELETIKEQLSSQDYFKHHTFTIIEKEPTLVIAPNYNIFSAHQEQEFMKKVEYFYVWEIEIRITERAGDSDGLIWIDPVTKKIIGAGTKQLYWLN